MAIARGGYMPARILADFFGVMELATFRIEHYRRTQKRAVTRVTDPLTVDVTGRRVLLVDDVSDSGDTFEAAIHHINERSTPAELRTAAIHHKIVSLYTPDFFAARVKTWRWIIYPWALMEDLTGFVEAMKPRPEGAPAMVDRLQREHGIRVSQAVMRDVLATLERTATRPPDP